MRTARLGIAGSIGCLMGLTAMGARAAEHVQQTFTWDAVTGLLLERLFPDL